MLYVNLFRKILPLKATKGDTKGDARRSGIPFVYSLMRRTRAASGVCAV